MRWPGQCQDTVLPRVEVAWGQEVSGKADGGQTGEGPECQAQQLGIYHGALMNSPRSQKREGS